MNADKICEKALLALAGGDTGALSVIYDTAARKMFALAYTVTGNYFDAEDVLQNTMIDVTRSCHGYAGGKAMAWLLTLTRHNAIDLVRKRTRNAEVPLDDMSEDEERSGEEGFALVEAMDMLSVLDEDEKQIVVMRLYSKMPYSEIAEIMGIKLFAAQKKYQRAIGKLKKYNPKEAL